MDKLLQLPKWRFWGCGRYPADCYGTARVFSSALKMHFDSFAMITLACKHVVARRKILNGGKRHLDRSPQGSPNSGFPLSVCYVHARWRPYQRYRKRLCVLNSSCTTARVFGNAPKFIELPKKSTSYLCSKWLFASAISLKSKRPPASLRST